jgi:ectoine utilization protein EutC
MAITFLNETEVRSAVTLPEAIEAMEKAFTAYCKKEATVPPVMHLDVPSRGGEVHVKSGYVHSSPDYVIKIAAGFYDNKKDGLPIGSGMMLVFSAQTGFPEAILMDNAYLTDLRTAAAGAVAAKYMALPEFDQVAVIGAGGQGRFQLQALQHVRNFKTVFIFDHHAANVKRYVEDMQQKITAELRPALSLEEAIQGSRIIVTTTPSQQPFLKASWIEPGTHITAMGSDGPQKQELFSDVLARADRIIADSISQCVQIGEIHHAIKEGLLKEQDIDGELGDVVLGRVKGRERPDEITVCDLTGVGVQDAFIAALAFQKAKERKLGRQI